MTEAEWNACTDPKPMLEFLGNKATERKLRLLAVACCRRVWPAKLDVELAAPLEIAERYADSLAIKGELWHASSEAEEGLTVASSGVTSRGDAALWAAIGYATAKPGYGHIGMVIHAAVSSFSDGERKLAIKERAAQALLVRCIFGLPAVRSPALKCSSTVTKLAEAIYADRAFDRLPILADALEDAGCTDPDILAHCRGPGPHVRGCWVVDLLLAKT